MQTTLGDRLGKLLMHLGINQTEAAARTGISKGTISHLIRNKVETYKNSATLAEGLHVNHDWLVYGRGGMLNPTIYYLPVIHEYFRLRLFLAEGLIDDSTRYLGTEHNYGHRAFATPLGGGILLCSSLMEELHPKSENIFLMWVEKQKYIVRSPDFGGAIFQIHEQRQYQSFFDINPDM